tara:strand:- start:67881 stop:68156 length:276 start_codon:yes stop_codon:yes gene_type:complete
MIIYKDVIIGKECSHISLVSKSELPIFERVLTTLDPTLRDEAFDHIGLKSHEVEFIVNSGLFEIEFRNDYSRDEARVLLNKMNREINYDYL